MAYTTPTIDDFKARFVREFQYGTDPTEQISDGDIRNAIMLALVNMNQDLFPDQPTFAVHFLLVAAHYLVLSIRNASGLASTFNFLESGKSVGSISQSFSIPQRILDNPEMAMLCTTSFGAMYLQMLLPQLTGNVGCVGGTTSLQT